MYLFIYISHDTVFIYRTRLVHNACTVYVSAYMSTCTRIYPKVVVVACGLVGEIQIGRERMA